MTVTSDVATVNVCDSKSDWSSTGHSNPDDNTSGSATWVALEPDSSSAHCMQATAASSTTGSWYEDTNVDMDDKLLIWWFWMSAKQEASYVSILRIRLHEGTGASGDNAEWDIPLTEIQDEFGGWIPLPIWATQPDAESGTFVPADVSSFELELRNNDSNFDIKLVAWDYMHTISELRASGTTPTVHDLQDFADHNLSALLGVMTQTVEAYTSRVNFEIGLAATTTTFTETTKSLQFLPFNSDQKIGFNFIDSTSGTLSFTLGALSSGSPVNGCLISYDPALTGDTDSSDIFTGASNCDTFKLYDTTFSNVRDTNLPTTSATREALGCKWSNCGPIIVSTCKVEDCTVLNSKGVGVLISSTSHNFKNNDFIGCDIGIEFDTAGTYSLDNVIFTGSVTADIENSANAVTVDSYADSNRNFDRQLGDGTTNGLGQSFDGGTTTRELSNARFFLSKTGTPTGNATAKLYAISGSVGGGDDVPTGAALATSDLFDVSTLNGTPTLTQFNFQDQVDIVSGTDYAITIEYSGGDGSNHVLVGGDSSAPSHTGNLVNLTGSWSAVPGTDLVFFVSGDGIVVVNTLNGSNPATFVNTGSPPGGTVINNAVNITITCIDAQTQVNIQNARVYITAAAGGPLPVGTTILTPASQLTNVSGVVTDTFNFTSNQPITGWARQGTPANGTLYKEAPINGTITTNGFITTAPLVKDE